jgi:hypothetical protein
LGDVNKTTAATTSVALDAVVTCSILPQFLPCDKTVSLSMDFNHNSRMSQSYRGSQQQAQGRTKKKEEDPDAFMRLVSISRS